MVIRDVPIPYADDLQTSAMQRETAAVRSAANASPFIGGRMLPSVSIAAGDTTVSHGLLRPWSGYVVTRVRSGTPAPLQDATTQPANAKLQLAVTSASAFVADIWVF